jgi:hypothetical protein
VSDQRITQLSPLPQASVQAAADVLAIVDLSASETKKVTAKDLFQASAQQADPGSIPIIAVDTSAGIPGDDVNFTKGDVVLGRFSTGAGQGEEIPCTAAGRNVIGAATAADQRTAMGLGSLSTANGFWLDGSSFAGNSTGNNTGDQTISLLGAVVGSGTGLINTTFGVGSVETDALADGAVTTVKLADDAVSAAKLGDNSSTVVTASAPTADGEFIGQLQVNQNNGFAYVYNGATWGQIAGFTAVSFVDGGSPLSYAVTFPVDIYSPVVNVSLDLQLPNTVWAGPVSGAIDAAPSFRPLVGADLPVASAAARGAVIPGAGLVMNGDLLDHANATPAQTVSGLTIDGQGHIAAAVPLGAADLPVATVDGKGAIIPSTGLAMNGELLELQPATADTLGGLKLGQTLQIDGTGLVDQALTNAEGTWAKVGVDIYGRVIQGLALEAGDIPGLDASSIISGEFDTARIGYNSITAYQLADYGIAHVNQMRPKPEFGGQLWINPIDRSAYIWVGTVDGPNSIEEGYWMSIGYGSAVEQNARFGGTYDAANNVVESINTYANQAGLMVGSAVPTPAQANAGIYLIVTEAGMGTTPAPEEQLAVGDWIFSLGTGTNWIKVAVISGAGGLVSDEDVAVAGASFSVPMPNVANQEEANELLWYYAQPASGVHRGTVSPSTEVLVDAAGVMTVGNLDEGEYA